MARTWDRPAYVPAGSERLGVVGWLALAAGPVSAREAGAECRCRRAGSDTATQARRWPARPRPVGDGLQAEIFFIPVAVDDLGRSVAFCGDGSGWPPEGVVGPEVVRAAIGAGLSKSEVHRLAGMARTAIDRIAGALPAMGQDPR
jgi:hypothetical protein